MSKQVIDCASVVDGIRIREDDEICLDVRYASLKHCGFSDSRWTISHVNIRELAFFLSGKVLSTVDKQVELDSR